MESTETTTESKSNFGTIILVLLLTLAFLVGTALFGYVGYQLLTAGSGRRAAGVSLVATSTPTATPSVARPTYTPLPTITPAARPTATKTPMATVAASPTATKVATAAPKPSPTKRPTTAGDGELPQTGLGSTASLATLLLASSAVGARWLRRRR